MVKDVLDLKVMREVKANWKQYLAVIVIAALAVTLFTGILANWQNFRYKVDTIYQESNMGDAVITTSAYDEELEDYLISTGIEYEKRMFAPAVSANEGVNVVVGKEGSLLNKPIYLEEELTTKSVLVTKNFYNKYDLANNKNLKITFNLKNLGFPDLGYEDVTLDFTVTGIMTHPEALDNSNYSQALIYVGEDALYEAVANFLTAENIPVGPAIVEMAFKDKENQFVLKGEKTQEIIDYVNENYEVIYALMREDLPTNLTIEADILQARDLILIFPVIFYLVAVLIILTSISQLITSELKNIGLLKALGYTKGEILWHYMKIFMALCLIGSILGMILGPVIIPGVMNQKYNILYQLPKIKVPFFRFEYIYSVIILLVLTAFITWFACYATLRLKPAESIHGINSYQMKPTLFDKIFKGDNWLDLRMAIRNMKRKVSRTLMVLLGVMGCSALLLCGFGIEDTLNNSIDTELNLIPFDVGATYNDYTSKKDDIRAIEHVSVVEEYAKYGISISKENLISSYVYLLPEDSQVFQEDYDENSCLISRKVAHEIGAKVGDEINFVYNNHTYTIEVTRIIDASFSQGIFISQAREMLEFNPTACWVLTDDVKYNEDVSQAMKDMGVFFSVESLESVLEQANNTLASIRVMTNTVKVFAILLALVVLYNLALLNFKERVRDVATLKVLGYTKNEISLSFLIEILILTVIGSLVGLSLGYPLMYAVMSINENPLLSYIYDVNWSSYLITTLITAGSSLLINILISRFTNRVKMVESLKSVE